MGDVWCYCKCPALPERPAPSPGPIPLLPQHLQRNGPWEAGPSLSLPGGGGAEGSCGQRPPPWPISWGAVGKARRVPVAHPRPWLGGCPQPTTIPCPAPALAPPNNNQRKRKRCHLPMPALRVSKPSGMGGARQLLGAWRGGGLPGGGGGHGTAYLEPPSLPEHAHRPHTHHHEVS